MVYAVGRVEEIAGGIFLLGGSDLTHPGIHMVEIPAGFLAGDEEPLAARGDGDHIEAAFDYDEPEGIRLGREDGEARVAEGLVADG